MPSFAIEVVTLMAPTEIYQQLGENTPEGFDKEAQVFVVVATHKNSINWLVLGEMNKDSQAFRDEIYTCASQAHNTLDRGCGKYYRGTNSVHVKRLHSDPFESMYNHNHYPLGGIKGIDFEATTFPEDVTPEEFKKHLVAFSEADAKMHNGAPRFLTKTNAYRIAEVFRKNYEENKSQVELQPAHSNSNREYTEEDLEELRLHQHEEQPCKAPDNAAHNTRGIGSERADERQPPEYSQPEYEYVLKFREEGKKRDAQVTATVTAVKHTLALQQTLLKAVEQATPGSPVAIAANAFTSDVAIDIALHARQDAILNPPPNKIAYEQMSEIKVYNQTILALLKDALKEVEAKEVFRAKKTLPGLQVLKEHAKNVQIDTLKALIESIDSKLLDPKEEILNFESILQSYQVESQESIPEHFAHNLKQMIAGVESPQVQVEPISLIDRR